jgi:hypothetical protein
MSSLYSLSGSTLKSEYGDPGGLRACSTVVEGPGALGIGQPGMCVMADCAYRVLVAMLGLMLSVAACTDRHSAPPPDAYFNPSPCCDPLGPPCEAGPCAPGSICELQYRNGGGTAPPTASCVAVPSGCNGADPCECWPFRPCTVDAWSTDAGPNGCMSCRAAPGYVSCTAPACVGNIACPNCP